MLLLRDQAPRMRFPALRLSWRDDLMDLHRTSIHPLHERCITHRCHILETGNGSHRFKASTEIAKQKRKETPALTTS